MNERGSGEASEHEGDMGCVVKQLGCEPAVFRPRAADWVLMMSSDQLAPAGKKCNRSFDPATHIEAGAPGNKSTRMVHYYYIPLLLPSSLSSTQSTKRKKKKYIRKKQRKRQNSKLKMLKLTVKSAKRRNP